MGRKLPPGEAERRAAERKRATFSGERYKTYDTSQGYGNAADWASMAAAFLNGDVTFDFEFTVNPKKRTTTNNPDLDILGLDATPTDFATLKKAYRRAVLAAFSAAGSNDTSPEYVNAFRKITLVFEKLKRQHRW